jgi:hypothetical protein
VLPDGLIGNVHEPSPLRREISCALTACGESPHVPHHPRAPHPSNLVTIFWVFVIFGELHSLTGCIAGDPSPELPCSARVRSPGTV